MTPYAQPARTKVETVDRTPPNPDDATQRDQVRQFLTALIVVATAAAALQAAVAFIVGSPRWWGTALLFGVLAIWVAAYPRRVVGRARITTLIDRVVVAILAVAVIAALLQPFNAVAATTALLIPLIFAVPYLEGRPLRRIMVITWLTSLVTVAAGFLPDDTAVPVVVIDLTRSWALALVFGLIFFMLYRTSERLMASGREFRRLFGLSSDLAETTEPALLAELVARHLAEAIGFDDCVLYALAPETGRLAPFGSYPVARALETDPESLAERPALAGVIHDRVRIVIDVADAQADPIEQARLRALGREVMLLLPLVARSEPVGVAELTTSGHHATDERRLALARTLAFEAAMAIENGRLYQQLRHRSLHDPLTGLANRSLFDDRVEHALARLARHEGTTVAVLFIDLDDFKAVNDTLGHARGDRLLALVAERLRTVVRPADTVARLGGDEFALLLDEIASGDEALAVATRVLDSLEPPFELAGQPVRVSVSVGVALRSVGDVTAHELVQEADLAMYGAKQAGKGRVVRFSPGLRRSPGTAADLGTIGTRVLESAAQVPDGSVAGLEGDPESGP